MKAMNWIIWILLLICALLLGAGWIFFRFAISRNGFPMPGKPGTGSGEADLRAWKRYWEVHKADYAWLKEQPSEPVQITSEDGLKLCGRYIPCGEAKRILICVHGYRGMAEHDFASVSRWLHAEQCDLLLITQRGSGESEGAWVTFGAKEKQDIRSWCAYVQSRNTKHLPIYLYGISMGCTSVLLSSTTGLPEEVTGIIADCGYSSARSIFAATAKRSFRIPPFPLLYIMELYCILFAKFSFQDADASEALKNNRIPVLFLHGEEDHFVVPENTLRNYEACAALKELVLIPNAGHASSYNENPLRYQAAVQRLFSDPSFGRKEELL